MYVSCFLETRYILFVLIQSSKLQATQFQVTRSNSPSTCVKQVCQSRFCEIALVIAKAVVVWVFLPGGLVGGRNSLCAVKMIALDLECIALLSEVRTVYSYFKLYNMHKMPVFNCAVVLEELKM